MWSTRTTCLVLLLSACLAFGLELQSRSTFTVPVFMWSDKQIFSTAQIADTITTGDVEFALASLLRQNTHKSSKLSSSFNQNAAAPEVVILFVEPELRTDQVPYIASAFASTPGGSFSHIKKAIETSASSLVMPYTVVSEVTLLDEALLDSLEALNNNANLFLSASGNLFARLRQQNGVKAVAVNSLISEMKSSNAFTNGVTDLVVVSFDNSDYADHDTVIGDLLESIQTSTKGNYVAIYTANMPTNSQFTWSFEEHATREFHQNIAFAVFDNNNGTKNDSNVTHHKINYFPGPFIEVLLICAVLVTMLFTGACAIFSLQTPDKWEAPKVKRDFQ